MTDALLLNGVDIEDVYHLESSPRQPAQSRGTLLPVTLETQGTDPKREFNNVITFGC